MNKSIVGFVLLAGACASGLVQAGASASASMSYEISVADLDTQDGVTAAYTLGRGQGFYNVSMPLIQANVPGNLLDMATKDGLAAVHGQITSSTVSIEGWALGPNFFNASANLTMPTYLFPGYIEVAPHTQVHISGVVQLTASASAENYSISEQASAAGGLQLGSEFLGAPMEIVGHGVDDRIYLTAYHEGGHYSDSLTKDFDFTFTNRSDQIATQYIFFGVGISGYSASMVPEPAAMWLWALGLAGVVGAIRRSHVIA